MTDRPPDRFRLPAGRTLRQHAARGTMVTAAFLTALTGLGALKGVVLAALLAPSDYGIWGILLGALGTLGWLKAVGVGDRYVQQDEEDQELAFHHAFSAELVVNAALLAVLLAAVPVISLVYGRPELLAPGFACCLIIPALQLQTPIWVAYRRLEFRRQRALQAVDPVVGFVVTLALALLDQGYWSLVVGALAGAYAGALAAVLTAPYRLRVVFAGLPVGAYVRFSTPLFVAGIGGIVVGQSAMFFGEDALGLVGAGVIGLALQFQLLGQRADAVLTGTLYPVICAARDRRDVLYETFEKSNRLALMWALPFGFGLTLFADDLVDLVLGDRWSSAVVVLQASGIVAALGQLGFSWTSYCRALGDTRPIAVDQLAGMVTFLACVPLLYELGLDGYALALLALLVTNLAVRTWYLRRLFKGFGLAAHAARALLPAVPAVLAVLAVRATGLERDVPVVVAELVLFGAVSAAATWGFERALLREAVGYLRRRGLPAT